MLLMEQLVMAQNLDTLVKGLPQAQNVGGLVTQPSLPPDIDGGCNHVALATGLKTGTSVKDKDDSESDVHTRNGIIEVGCQRVGPTAHSRCSEKNDSESHTKSVFATTRTGRHCNDSADPGASCTGPFSCLTGEVVTAAKELQQIIHEEWQMQQSQLRALIREELHTWLPRSEVLSFSLQHATLSASSSHTHCCTHSPSFTQCFYRSPDRGAYQPLGSAPKL